MRKSLVLATVFIVLTAFSSAVMGQELVGSRIFGSITDPRGAVVPDVNVTISNPATGFSRTVKTGADGTFLAPQIVAETYDIEVSSGGFKSIKVTGIVVRVNENVRQDVQLQLGEVTAKIEVQAQATLVNTYTSALSQTIDSRRVVDLPMNSRDVTALSMLVAGATDPPASTGFYANSSGFAGTSPSVNGSKIQ